MTETHSPVSGVHRPTPRLAALQRRAGPTARALDSGRLGLARATRHSFARSLLRAAASGRWNVATERFEVDAAGRGEIIYRVDLSPTHQVRLVAFSNVIDEADRTDRVIAESWDLTATLCRGGLSTERMAAMRANVATQESGRADADSLVWTRANRSQRFFDHVVDRLAEGRQPDPDLMGDGAYVMRSTAFYANGKWGLGDYDGIEPSHPLKLPYRAQMLTAWLVRELSLDLVEHCAAARSAGAVPLEPAWRRYFGLGNATGLGMVPFVINHPRIFDAWIAIRELPLANALSATGERTDGAEGRLVELLERAVGHFAERSSLATAPYPPGPELAEQLQPALDAARAGRPFDAVHRSVAGPAQAVVEAVLIELDDSLDGELEALLECPPPNRADPATRCSELRRLIATDYGWIDDHRFDDPDAGADHYFWFYSADSQEPRRGVRGRDRGVEVELPIDIARSVQALSKSLEGELATSSGGSSLTIGEFLVAHPQHRAAVDRVMGLVDVRYGEAPINPLAADFLPLDLQRFQLATYGMENFSPQSTDWLRVTLFSGAPGAADIGRGVDYDWMFPRKPSGMSANDGDHQ